VLGLVVVIFDRKAALLFEVDEGGKGRGGNCIYWIASRKLQVLSCIYRVGYIELQAIDRVNVKRVTPAPLITGLFVHCTFVFSANRPGAGNDKDGSVRAAQQSRMLRIWTRSTYNKGKYNSA
jgi:hypothetical protein